MAIPAGLESLRDISLSARPLDKDLAVARAWGQAAWADYSGVSRTLSQLGEADVEQIADVLEQVSQPFIDREVHLALAKCRQVKVPCTYSDAHRSTIWRL